MKAALILMLAICMLPAALAAAPTVGTVTVTDPIDLSAGSTKAITCNATFSDADGWANVSSVNATLWDVAASAEGNADDSNDHYTNASCSIGTNTSESDAPATCTFDLQYYANNGTWTCKIRAYDAAASGTNQTNTTINTLLALNIPSTINFGTMSLGDTSTNTTENETSVENYGNVLIDVDLSGDDMSCSSGTIPVGNIKYSDTDNTAYASMTALTTSATTLNLNVAQRTNGVSTKTTYWKIQIPSTGVGGSCTNTITFTAVAG